jgi:hypothetical protein
LDLEEEKGVARNKISLGLKALKDLLQIKMRGILGRN